MGGRTRRLRGILVGAVAAHPRRGPPGLQRPPWRGRRSVRGRRRSGRSAIHRLRRPAHHIRHHGGDQPLLQHQPAAVGCIRPSDIRRRGRRSIGRRRHAGALFLDAAVRNPRLRGVRAAHRRRCELAARHAQGLCEPSDDRLRRNAFLRYQAALVAHGGGRGTRRLGDGMGIVKQTGVIAWLVGIAALIGLVIWSGIDSVSHAVASVGWGIVAVVMVRIVTVSVAGVGWWLLFPPDRPPQLQTCVLMRFIREAANVLLPMAQVGGDLIGARLLTLRGVAGSLAAASVIVDVLLQAATQFLFACLGLAVLIALGASATVAHTAAVALAVAAMLLLGFYLPQRQAGRRILRWGIKSLSGDQKWRVLGTIDAVYQQLTAIYASRSRLLASTIVHLAGWLFGVAEVLVVFAFMGHPIALGEALVIESLL